MIFVAALAIAFLAGLVLGAGGVPAAPPPDRHAQLLDHRRDA